MKDHRDVILRPVVSEKSYQGLEVGVYTFVVAPSASKPEISDAIEEIFDVTVVNVNTFIRKGKRKRDRRSRRLVQGSNQKRAHVTLAEGDSIELFES